MASTAAAQTRDFARRFFQVVLERGGESWVAASDAFERTVAAHADHPYVAYIQANRARRAGFTAAAERVREQEFPQIERRKAGTRRNAPVFYRIGRPDAGFQLHLPYEVPSSHPLRAATGAAKGNPLRRDPETAPARSPWRRRLAKRASQDASPVAAAIVRRLVAEADRPRRRAARRAHQSSIEASALRAPLRCTSSRNRDRPPGPGEAIACACPVRCTSRADGGRVHAEGSGPGSERGPPTGGRALSAPHADLVRRDGDRGAPGARRHRVSQAGRRPSSTSRTSSGAGCSCSARR